MAPSTGAWAQWSEATSPSQVAHEHAMEAYDNEQFALALHLFELQMATAGSPASDAYVEASYYAAMSSLALNHRDVVYRREAFMTEFPESPLALKAHWSLANHHYKRKNYSKASETFESIRIRDLSPEKRDEYRFKLGHCYFEREAYEKARVPLYEVLDVEGEFQAAAQY